MSEAVYSVNQWRRHVVLGVFAVGALVLAWRAIDLQVVNNEDFQSKGNSAHLKTVAIPAHRGMIVDRNNEPLAVSTPVSAVWAKPAQLLENRDRLPELAALLGLTHATLIQDLEKRIDRDFMYLKRRGTPELVQAVKAMDVEGVYFQREYKRFYPSGEVTSHLLGFTDVDDRGQEGLELAFDRHLSGEYGSKRVMQDRKGNVLADIEMLDEARSGGQLVLSIDKRIQYLAYRELKATVEAHKAKSGSMVVLDALSGEVLAMVNQPAFNPNARNSISNGVFRNRVVTDLMEPGSTVKPFIVAAALDSGRYRSDSLVNTSPGQVYVGRNRVKDIRDYGLIDISTVIKKSSNVGVAKMSLEMDKEYVWQKYVDLGFGSPTGAVFPGEQTGHVNDFHRWSRIDQATIAFGYGMASNVLQLARAYTVFANDGAVIPVTLQRIDEAPQGVEVFSAETMRAVLKMMESVVEKDGTAPLAQVPGYRVAGKTGTVKKMDHRAGGYTDDKYLSLFAGVVPASNPRLIAVVMIDEPSGDDYYGGVVAGPVFSKVMAGALRLLDVKPDGIEANKKYANTVAQRSGSAQVGAL